MLVMLTLEPSQTSRECSVYCSTRGNILVVTIRWAWLKLWSISVWIYDDERSAGLFCLLFYLTLHCKGDGLLQFLKLLGEGQWPLGLRSLARHDGITQVQLYNRYSRVKRWELAITSITLTRGELCLKRCVFRAGDKGLAGHMHRCKDKVQASPNHLFPLHRWRRWVLKPFERKDTSTTFRFTMPAPLAKGMVFYFPWTSTFFPDHPGGVLILISSPLCWGWGWPLMQESSLLFLCL